MWYLMYVKMLVLGCVFYSAASANRLTVTKAIH